VEWGSVLDGREQNKTSDARDLQGKRPTLDIESRMQLKGFPVVTAQLWSAAILRRFSPRCSQSGRGTAALQKNAERRTPNTEHRTPNIERRIQHKNPAGSDKSGSFGLRRYFAASSATSILMRCRGND